MINELPTIFEVVAGGGAKKPLKEKSSVSNNSGNKSKSITKVVNNFFSSNLDMKCKYSLFIEF